jgi:hypothetical protein
MVGIAAWERAMGDLHEASTRAGIPVVMMTQGVSFDRRLWRVSTRLRFHYLDLAPPIRAYLRAGGYEDYLESPLVVRQGDPHPSARGHEIIAAELLQFLQERGLLEAAAPQPVNPSGRW